MKDHPLCNKCEAPLFFYRTLDAMCNSVLTLNCWNGHYAWINIENIIEEEPKKRTKNNVITYFGFFNSAATKKNSSKKRL